MILRKKNDLLYKDATCLCHGLVLFFLFFFFFFFFFLVGLAPLDLFRPNSSVELLFSLVLFFLALRRAV